MLEAFIKAKLTSAKYKLLADGSYFGNVPDIQGVWANAGSLEDCRNELAEVIEDWVILALRSGDEIAGLNIKTDRRELVEHA